MTIVDPFEYLASRRDPVLDRRLDPGDDPVADELVRTIVSGEPSRAADRRRRWARRATGGLVIAAVVGGGAVAASRWLSEPADPVTLSCYSDASSDPDIQIGLMIDPAITPIEQCAPFWSDGTLGTGESPALAMCVTDNGITAVIPGTGDTCVAIGYAERAPLTGERNVAAELTSAVSDMLSDAGCLTEDEVVAGLERMLVDLDADGWTIGVSHHPDAELPCAIVGVDGEREELFIAARPRFPEDDRFESG